MRVRFYFADGSLAFEAAARSVTVRRDKPEAPDVDFGSGPELIALEPGERFEVLP